MKTLQTLFSAVVALLLFGSQVVYGQIPAPASPQQGKILILNATAHVGTGQVIQRSAIGFEKGTITFVGDAGTLDKSKYDQVIDASGKHVYPGFISTNNNLGLTEIEAVRATNDFRDVTGINPHIRALIAFNTDSRITPTVRSNGVLLTQATPRGGLISGSSSVMSLDAWNWEDAVVKADDGIHLNWPKMFQQSGWWAEPGPVKPNKKAQNQISQLNAFFGRALAYSKTEHPAEKDLRFEAMRGIFDGSKNLYIHADYVKDITAAGNFVHDLNIPKPVLVGGYDSWMVTDMLKENKFSVILRRIHSLPKRPEDDIDRPFKLPSILAKAGITFCFGSAGDMEAMNTRNLPFYAGTAVAYGLDPEEAVAAISLNAAKILGISNKLGSLEVGKQATLFISTGDALDILTNNVEMAFVSGRSIDLNNHQKALYEKYKAKYEQEKAIKEEEE